MVKRTYGGVYTPWRHTHSERYTRWGIHTEGIYTRWKYIHGETYLGWSVHMLERTQGGVYTR